MKTVFDEAWKNWIRTNVANGQDRDGIFKILLDEGYQYRAICQEMNYEPSVALDDLVNPLQNQRKNEVQETTNRGVKIDRNKLFIPNASSLDSDSLELYTLEDFLSVDECEKLIERIRANLRASTLSSYEADQSYRTSRTCDLARSSDPFLSLIHSRMCRLVGIDPAYSEEIQGQYYEIGQEFKAHTDYFETHEMASHAAEKGQRTYTFMIYLNDVEQGGETRFLNVGASFSPRAGSAVIWNSLKPDGTPNVDSLHQALPVVKGYKAVITNWFRSSTGIPKPPPIFTKELNEYIPNYTKVGFLKTQLPVVLFNKITRFYQDHRASLTDEDVPGDFLYNKNQKGRGSALVELSDDLRREIHDVMKPEMENWCGKELDPTYVYGIREYNNGAILKLHRDRPDTHIISAIINVAQQVNEEWPLIIEDNYYRRHNVMLAPGDVIFYEGARLIHGRPIAFDGASFANVFCHFRPKDYSPVSL